MPVYTYRCENCGIQFEKHQSSNDDPLKTRPECRKVFEEGDHADQDYFQRLRLHATDHRSARV